MSKRFRVVSIGDLVADIYMLIHSFPVYPLQHQWAGQTSLEPGGAGNFLIAGARLGMDMHTLGILGDDDLGAVTLNILRSEGVDISQVVVQPGSSSTTVVVLADGHGGHVFLGKYGEGPHIELTPGWKTAIEAADVVFGAGYTLHEARLTEAFLQGLEYARSCGKIVYMDLSPEFRQVPQALRERVIAIHPVIVTTEDEVGGLLGHEPEADPTARPAHHGLESALALLSQGFEMICLKRGERGCAILTRDRMVEHPGYPVQLVDATAAGDSFDAAFIYGRLQGWPLPRVAAFANAMGAAKVRKAGSGRQVPTRAEVLAVLEEFGEEEKPLTAKNAKKR